MGPCQGETETIAREWLARDGKRWRPFLTVAAFQALRKDVGQPLPEDLREIAVAVECFHKASLVHDDIEDKDAERYGEKTLHEEYGTAVALNVGDLLIGEGYRLIGASKLSPEQKSQMLLVAAQGQRELCRGQGAELCWARDPGPLSQHQVLDIFRKKTAPAFEVALRLGAICAGVEQHADVQQVLQAFSEALGIAYQIRDDLDDFTADDATNDIAALRPTLLLAIAHDKAKERQKELLASIWRRSFPEGVTSGEIRSLYTEVGADTRARTLLETYKEEAIRCLGKLENPNLKGLLRRVLGKIFNDVEMKGWCKELETKNRAQDETGPAEAAQVGSVA